MSTATTLGIGTLLWSSINNNDNLDIGVDPTKNLTIVDYSNINKQTLFKEGYSNTSNISAENIDLIQKCKIISLLRKVNNLEPKFFDETLETQSISTNLNDGTAFKKFNDQTSCAVIYRSDIDSNDYYPYLLYK